jgi:hypothetical protein
MEETGDSQAIETVAAASDALILTENDIENVMGLQAEVAKAQSELDHSQRLFSRTYAVLHEYHNQLDKAIIGHPNIYVFGALAETLLLAVVIPIDFGTNDVLLKILLTTLEAPLPGIFAYPFVGAIREMRQAHGALWRKLQRRSRRYVRAVNQLQEKHPEA